MAYDIHDGISLPEGTSFVIDLDLGTGENPDLGTDVCALTQKDFNDFGEDAEKPSSYTLTLGDELTAEVNSSQGDKLEVGAVQPGDDGDGSYSILVTGDSDPSNLDNIYFSGDVDSGESFTIDGDFGSQTFVHIFSSDGGALLQTISFHTSCSAPLVIGDQYGSISLAGAVLEGKDTGTLYTVGSTETDGDAGVIYEITGGNDADDFDVDPDTGEVTFKNSPDYENPTDSDGDNKYDVEVTAFYVDANGVKTGEISEVKTLEVCVEDELEFGSISGRYFFDDGLDFMKDCDGLDNDFENVRSETAVVGATVSLCDANGVVIATTTSDENGEYKFTGLEPGTYSVRFAPTEGKVFTDQDVGPDDTIDSDVDSFTGETGVIVVGDGENVMDVDAGVCPLGITLISAIQGSGAEAAIQTEVKIQGVVTAVAYNGFFVQEEDADADADNSTSEGIFVFPGSMPMPAVGDLVTVQGTSTEFFGLTEITNVSDLTVDASDQLGFVTASNVTADADGSFAGTDFEALEGMLLTFTDDLTVTQLFNYERFGQLELSTVGLQTQYTQTDAPDPTAFAENAALVDAQRIILDDASDGQNPGTLPYDVTNDGLSGGDVFENLTGVLGFNRGDYKVVASETQPELTDAVEIEAAPADVGGNLKIATFNVLNYFVTLDTPENQDSVGPSGLDPRGANSAAELEIQASKIVAALAALDADVVGLVEIENDADDAAVADLVARLNLATGKTYDYVPTGYVGADAIKVAFIYDTATVEIAADGAAVAILDDLAFTDPINLADPENRPALAVTFTELATNETFTAVNNHLKSKGSPVPNDPDTGDGEANGSLTRLEAAKALDAWIATDPTGVADRDVVIMGDLNSYAAEDPITYLEGAGYTNLLASYEGSEAFTYRFSGEWGTLDYALANEFLIEQVTGATAWNVNSLAPSFLNYNDNIQDASEPSFEQKPESLFAQVDPTSPIASSDHDPIVFGLNLYTNIEISVDKMTVNGNGIAGDSIGVLAGGSVGWRYVMENLGEVDFDSVTLEDSDASIGIVDAADTGYMLVESIDADGILQVGETWTIDITGTAIDITDGNYATYTNSVTATGTYIYLETEATDDSSYTALNSGYVLSGDHEDFGDTFRAIFTPDPDAKGRGIEYQLTATNPGQFRYDILVEDLGADALTIEVPWPFVTQGSMAIEWYDSVDVSFDEDGALQLLPGAVAGSTSIEIDLTDYAKGASYGDTIEIALDPTALGIDAGFVMLSTDLDYGLKGVGGWEFGDETARAPQGLMDQFEGEEFIFASSVDGSADSISVDNDFKALRGIGGFAETAEGAPAADVQLIADYDDAGIAVALSDEDGWYFFDRKTGKKDSPDVWLDGDRNGVVSDGDTLLAEDVSIGGSTKFVHLDLIVDDIVDDFSFV
jgi:predicted extracellular nuclease